MAQNCSASNVRQLIANPEVLRRIADAAIAAAVAGSVHPDDCIPIPEYNLEAIIAGHYGGSQLLIIAVQTPPSVRFPTCAQLSEWFRLTSREAQVALLLAERRSNEEIAIELDVTAFTAWRHTEKVLSKLGIARRTDVERILAEWRPRTRKERWRPGMLERTDDRQDRVANKR